MMDWNILTIIATGLVSVGSLGLSIYNARVSRDSTEIDNLKKIIETYSTELARLEAKVTKLEHKDRSKTEAIQKAYRCKLIESDKECPVISHILSRYQQQ